MVGEGQGEGREWKVCISSKFSGATEAAILGGPNFENHSTNNSLYWRRLQVSALRGKAHFTKYR